MKYNNEKGSVTMIVVVTILFIVILLSSFLIYTTARRRAQIKETEAISKAYDGDMNEIYNTKIAEENQEIVIEGVRIPKGFYYVGGTKADGIVISDAKEDENKYKEQTDEGNSQIPGDGLIGNQFVWVPVENITDFKIYPCYKGAAIQLLTGFNEPSKEGHRYPNELEEYNSMKQSVEINRGFYVARYESGKETIGGVETAISKKGAEVWNDIAWGDSMTEIGTEGAVAKAKGMYTDKSKYNVTSTLIYGSQWDAIMAWIDPNYKTTSCESDSFVKNSAEKGNYSGILASCGSNDLYRVNNIYDLGGNAYEWTMEASGNLNRAYRGGSYKDVGINAPASARYGTYPAFVSDESIGFRVVLYL